ncbi:HAD-like protein [Polychaeton citri CBS 116435]|uniref:HAD-like protein n=1 Tax=Polychaeton citri CBS 116435 TaxID=1314669 RepID=A0A9P4UNS7_9PEZI|nr:HAD-like protein [Polychaeton citri CBS 116435]
MPHHEDNDFSAPSQTHTFSALLFDMDGTLIDSTSAIEKYWHGIGKEISVDPATILQTSHGRRSIDVLSILAPHLATWDYVCEMEARVPKNFGSDAVEIPGARGLLAELEAHGAPWAIVTSGTRGLVTGWLDVMGLAHPEFLVSAEEVKVGKPDPACYRLGAQRLGKEGVDGSKVLVLEDAPAGVRAGKAAGFKVVALATSHGVGQLKEAGADWIVEDMRSVGFRGFEGKNGVVSIEIKNALVQG